MSIHKGQIYNNKNGNKFVVLEVNENEVKLQSMDETEQYFPHEVITCSLDSFNIQVKNLNLSNTIEFNNLNVSNTIEFNKEVKYELHIKRLMSNISDYQIEISNLNDKINTTKEEIGQYLEKLHKINPNNNPVFKLGDDYITQEQAAEAVNDIFAEQTKRKQDTINNAKDWFELTCPKCNTKFKCTFNGESLHCYDYLTETGQEIYGELATNKLECPNCGKITKEEKWNRKNL